MRGSRLAKNLKFALMRMCLCCPEAGGARPHYENCAVPSPVLLGARPPHGRGQGARGLLRRLPLERLPARLAQPVLPAVPALELSVTAQTRGRSRIGMGCRAFLPAMSRPLPHGSLQP